MWEGVRKRGEMCRGDQQERQEASRLRGELQRKRSTFGLSLDGALHAVQINGKRNKFYAANPENTDGPEVQAEKGEYWGVALE